MRGGSTVRWSIGESQQEPAEAATRPAKSADIEPQSEARSDSRRKIQPSTASMIPIGMFSVLGEQWF